MLRHTGHAAREVGRAVHHVCHFLLTAAIVLSLAIAACAWRLSQGPVDLDFMKSRIEKAVSLSVAPAQVSIGSASIAWAGFSHGLDQPLRLRVTDLTVDEPDGGGAVHIPLAEASLSARWMLIGRILPRSIMLQGAHLLLTRNVDGSFGFDIGGATGRTGRSPLLGLAAILGAPRESDLGRGSRRLSQLSEVSIRAATMLLDDRRTGTTWSADPANIDLLRHRGGGVDGRATLAVAIGGQRTVATSMFQLAPAARSAHVEVSLSQVTPKALAGSAPLLAPLAALDVPLTLKGAADLGPDLIPTQIRLDARAGAGTVRVGGGTIPIHAASLVLDGTLQQATVEQAMVELQAAPGAAISTLAATGTVTHKSDHFATKLHLTLDHVGFAGLPALWPPGIAANARAWITQNITAGTAHDGKADLVLDTPDSAPDVTLVSATATLEGDGITATWLPTVAPVEQARAHLVLTDPDKIEIDVRGAHQVVRSADPIAIPYAHLAITGLAENDQVATVQCEATGPIASAIALLKEPRLHLLSQHPIDLRAPSGDARTSIHAMIPLRRDLSIDDVALSATANLTKAHLSGFIAGRDLDDGALLLEADTNHLSVQGSAVLGGIPANLNGTMDFRAGPPSQVLQHFQASGQATAQQLANAGLDSEGALTGQIGLNVTLDERRSGDGELAVDANLSQAALKVTPLAWEKPVGSLATASARLVLAQDKLVGIDPVRIDGTGIQVQGSVAVVNGKPDVVQLERAVLGRTDVRGTIRLPQSGPIEVDLSGPTLDASAKIMQPPARPNPAAPPGPAWTMHGRFERVDLAHDQIARDVVVSAASDGTVMNGLAINGRIGSGRPFAARIGPARGNHRVLGLSAGDAGSFLHAMDMTSEIKGGELTVSGDFDDTTPAHTLSGTLDISDFRAINAPALGKLLQAVTLYGLVDVLSGPGLGFSRLTAPFQLNDDTLVLHDARAFSSSLGLTVQGRIDRVADRLDLQGTLVPAYVFNSLLGRIPLIGRLFTAEKGGGLFAMNYSLTGPMDNPEVAANPLSALTPGILRGMFGLFDHATVESRSAPRTQTRLDQEAAGGNAQP